MEEGCSSHVTTEFFRLLGVSLVFEPTCIVDAVELLLVFLSQVP